MKLAFAGVLSLALASAGCASTTGGGGVLSDPVLLDVVGNPTLQDIISKARVVAGSVCGIVPTVETISSIATNLSGNIAAQAANGVATKVADMFCAAVTAKKSAGRKFNRSFVSGVVDYGTVTINGRAVRLQGTPH